MSFESSSTNQPQSLQDALACLDLSLESELELYRRQNLQAAGALALSESTESDNALDETSMLFKADSEERSLANLDNDLENANPLQSLSSQAEKPQEIELISLSAPASNPQDIARGQTDDSKDSGPTERSTAFFGSAVEEDPETLPEPYNAETVSKPEALDRFLDPSIEDYLESSEALLKHLDNSEGMIAKPAKPTRSTRLTTKPSPRKSSPVTSTWAFKLLIGILAIALLIGIAMLILKQLTRSRSTPVPQPSIQSSIQPSVQPSVQTTTASLSASPSVIAVTPLSLRPTSAPISSPNATSTPVGAPKSTAKPSAFYVVLAPYKDDASLQRARQLVPDAFIADIKGQRHIQLAFLDDLQRAQRLVADLKNEGFPATIASQN
jgi:cell division septation protein DedD